MNRDLQPTCSVETPICGVFMLVDKTAFYIVNSEVRRRIAADRRQCLESGYSDHDCMKETLPTVSDLRKG